MARQAASTGASTSKSTWRPTKIMNMRDLSRDDDFLSHLLVEKLGTGDVPLVVHKMDPTRKLPKTKAEDLLDIVRRMVSSKGSQQTLVRQAVDELLQLNAVRYYLKISAYDQKQTNAFATHASRYFELYLPGGSIEIAHTSRYSHRTGKSELCILATRPLAPGNVISELKGSMANLTEEEDKELKRTSGQADGVGIRRDFSVIHSKQLKKNHLFLGPARFVNHDCDHNVELFREGRYITFRVIKPINVGEEVTAHYGDGYFGRKNRHCLCASCERHGRGGYGPQLEEELSDSGSGSSNSGCHRRGTFSESSDSEEESDADTINFNERRTRRGVYAVLPDDEDEATEAEQDVEGVSDLTSVPPSAPIVASPAVDDHGLLTPEPEPEHRGRALVKGKGRDAPEPIAPIPRKATPSTSSFRPVILTRAQKAREASAEASTSAAPSRAASKTVAGRSVSAARQLVTPPLTVDSASTSVRSSSRLPSAGETVSSLTESSRVSTPVKDKKGKGRATASVSDLRDVDVGEPEARHHLRPRVSAPIFDQTLSKKKPSDAPRGLDGKPLPLCITCRNILPLISVNSEVVWGHNVGRTGKRGRPKKDAASECPRCLRHSAIYDRKWPARVEGDTRAYIPPQPPVVPHVVTATFPRKVTPSALATVNRKLLTGLVGRPKRRVEDDEEDERPAKKRVINKVAMSEEARQMLQGPSVDGRRSGRARVPSLKLREGEPGVRVSPRLCPTSSSSLSAVPDSPERKPAPALPETPKTPTTPAAHSTSVSPKNLTPKSLAVAAQPRDANGRFGKKSGTNGRFMRKFTVTKRLSFGRRMVPRPTDIRSIPLLVEDGMDGFDDEHGSDDFEYGEYSDSEGRAELGEEALEDVVLKRTSSDSDPDDVPRKKIRITESDNSDNSPTTSPRFVMGRGSLLRPNPISFARRKWASEEKTESASVRFSLRTMLQDDDDRADEPDAIVCKTSVNMDHALAGDESVSNPGSPTSVSLSRHSAPAARVSQISLFKPSPMNLRRRWAPLTAGEDAAEEQTSVPQTFSNPQSRLSMIESGARFAEKQKNVEVDLRYPQDSEDEFEDEYTTDEEWWSDSGSVVADGPSHPAYKAYLRDRMPESNATYSRLAAPYFQLPRPITPEHRPRNFSMERPPVPNHGLPSTSPLTSPNSSFIQSPRPRLAVEKSKLLDHLHSRVSSPEATAPDPCGNSTDDSERAVERMLGSRPTTSTPATPPSKAGATLESSPGYAWKRTVLLPTNSGASWGFNATSSTIPSASTQPPSRHH